jgi:hypothetical protein
VNFWYQARMEAPEQFTLAEDEISYVVADVGMSSFASSLPYRTHAEVPVRRK